MKKIYLVISMTALFTSGNLVKAQSEVWGLTANGGDGFGTIYGLPTGSTGIATQYNFAGSPGANPQFSKLLSNGNTKLYGLTNAGGANNVGVLFEYDTATNVYTRKVDLSSANGANPKGSLMKANNGKFYGMTQLGGSSNLGVIFEYDPSTNTYTKKVDFTGTTGAAIGSQPFGTLMEDPSNTGKLYGVTRFGGANNVGVIFEYNYSTNTYTKKVDLTGTAGAAPGTGPFGQLVKVGLKLYGLTSSGGVNNFGTIFEYDHINDVFVSKIDLTGTTGANIGNNPQGSMVLASNGNLYGMTAQGGAANVGVIFQYSVSSNTYTKLMDFTSGTGGTGANPTGDLMQATNGKLYGMTRSGGTGNVGALFEYDLAGPTYTKKIDMVSANTGGLPLGSLMQVSTGKLYGMTQNGAATNVGALYNYQISTNTLVKKIDFNSSNGGFANGHLIQANNGKLYGLTSVGGANNLGVLFEYDKALGTYTKKVDLSATNGSSPFGSLVQSSLTGKLYGATSAGGTSALGTIFDYDISTNTYTKRVDFTGAAGAAPGSVPYGAMVEFSGNNKLYGLSRQVVSGSSVLYEFDPATNTYTKKIDLLAANGYSAFGALVESSGKLYGMTFTGGANNIGVIFEYDPSLNTYTKKVDFTGTTGVAQGSQPSGAMVQTATVGILYGMTKNGGANDLGVIFEYNVALNTYTKKFDMVAATGSLPLGSLIRAANGNLYGVTSAGGTNSQGVLFEYNIATNTYTKKFDFTGTNGSSPAFTQLLEICTKPSIPGSITSSTNAICSGDASTQNYSISAIANATSYAWTLPVGSSTVSGAGTTNFAANLSGVAAGVYTFGVGGVNICGTGTLGVSSITVNSLPSISVTNGTICSGKSFVIVPTGASTYSITGNIFTVSPTVNTNYSVTGQSSFGCASSNTAIATVVVNALPVVSANSGSICFGNSFTITPSMAPTTAASYTITGNLFVVSPASSSNYSISGTDVNGCVSSNTFVTNVAVNPLPVISVNNATMCVGGSVILSPTGAGTSATYTLGGTPGAGPFVLSPLSSTNYTVAATNSLGCISSNTPVAAVTVYTLPVLSVNNPSMCAGTNATITPSGAGVSGSYTVNGVPGPGPFVVSPLVTTNYNVTGSSLQGCLSSNTIISAVTVYTLPVISVGSGTLCSGNSFTLSPSGAGTGGVYSIIPGGLLTVSPLANTVYSVSGTNSLGCVSSAPALASLTVIALPIISVSSGTVCAGRVFSLTPSGAGVGGTYTIAPGGLANVTPASNTTYTVTGSNSFGCVSSSPALGSVTVVALPVITATSGAICFGQVFTTTVSGASTYTYNNGITSVNAPGSTTLNPTSTTSYSITGTSPVGCRSTIPTMIIINVNPLPPVSITGNTVLCEGQSAVLTATGANTYNWGTSTNSSISITPSITSNYSVTGTDLNFCSNSAFVIVTVNPLPTITVINGAVCPGNSFTLTPGGASTYTYSSGSNIVTPSSTTSYTVTGTSAQGCVAQLPAVATVSVVNILTVTVNGNTSVCLGGVTILTANGASSYNWSNGANTNTVLLGPVVNTTYTVIGSSGTCNDTTSVLVTVNPLPNIAIASTASAICLYENAKLSSSGANTYTWSTAQTGTSIVVSPSVTTTYSIQGTDPKGCTNQSFFTLNVNACVGLADYSKNGGHLLIYPNPSTGEFVIELSESADIEIFNSLGQKVYSGQLTEGKNNLELNNHTNGIYFVQMKLAGHVSTYKLIKE